MSLETSPLLSVVFHVIDILEGLGLRYHLGGSFASAVHGVPRQTMDADLVVELDDASVKELVNRLADGFYVDLEVAIDAVARSGSFNAVHLETGFKVDFFVKGPSEFDEVELERSQLIEVIPDPPRSLYIKTAEDTVLRKLLWFRSGGEVSERQWRDVIGVLRAVGESIDRDYLRHWAADLGVEDLLEQAIAEGESG
jgi:hypothetical protein